MAHQHRIEVLYIDACPNWERTVENLEVATALLHMDALISTRCVESVADPAAIGFAGSPTVLVDGTDPFPSSGPVTVLACRMYAWEDTYTASPSTAHLIEVLRPLAA